MSATIIYLVVRSGFAGPFSFPVIKRINLMFCVCRMMPFAFSHLNQPFTPPQPPFIPLYIPSTTLLRAHSQHLKQSQTSVLIDVNRV